MGWYFLTWPVSGPQWWPCHTASRGRLEFSACYHAQAVILGLFFWEAVTIPGKFIQGRQIWEVPRHAWNEQRCGSSVRESKNKYCPQAASLKRGRNYSTLTVFTSMCHHQPKRCEGRETKWNERSRRNNVVTGDMHASMYFLRELALVVLKTIVRVVCRSSLLNLSVTLFAFGTLPHPINMPNGIWLETPDGMEALARPASIGRELARTIVVCVEGTDDSAVGKISQSQMEMKFV